MAEQVSKVAIFLCGLVVGLLIAGGEVTVWVWTITGVAAVLTLIVVLDDG
jgi:hypothetical protein